MHPIFKIGIMSNQKEKLFTEFPGVSTAEWMDAIVKDLKGADFNKKLVWKTSEGFNVNPFYRAEDIENLEITGVLPGEFPYVRGSKTKNNNWEIRQDFRINDIEKCNHLASIAASKGADSVGVCVRNVEEYRQMEQLLKGIDLTVTGIHMLRSRNYELTLELFTQYLEKHGIGGEQVRGSIDFDPLHYALQFGHYYGSFANNLKETVYTLSKYGEALPNMRLLSVNAAALHNAGGYNIQELGYGMNWACEYFRRLTDLGLSIDFLSPRTTLVLSTGSNYFMEIAKIRAARVLWANMVSAFKPKEDKSMEVFIHAADTTWNKSIYDPYVNMLRSTTQTMSAAIGGANSIHVSDFSSAFKMPDEFSSRIARNQQIILKEESFFNRTVDPAAGSYYIENLTLNLAQQAWGIFMVQEEKGGFTGGIETNTIQNEIEKCAAKRSEDLAKRKLILTGVNQFPNLTETELDNIEIRPAHKNAEGKFKAIHHFRGAEAFESLRLETEKYTKEKGNRPKVFLLTYGNLAMRKARAGFATNFFGCLGYEIIDNPGFENGVQGAETALKSGAQVVVLCSSDEEYSELASQACPILKDKVCIVYAGAAADEEPFRALGVEEFIHVRSNVLETLRRFQEKLLQ